MTPLTEDQWLGDEQPYRMIMHAIASKASSERKERLILCGCVRRHWRLLTDRRSQAAVKTAEAFADQEVSSSVLRHARDAAKAVWEMGEVGFIGNEDVYGKYCAAADAYGCVMGNLEDALNVTFRPSRPVWISPHASSVVRDVIGNPFRRWLTEAQGEETVLGGYVCEKCSSPHTLKAGREIKCLVCKSSMLRKQRRRDLPRVRVLPAAWMTQDVHALAHVAYTRRDSAGLLFRDNLLVLSDALEEAGCPAEVWERKEVLCGWSCPVCGDKGFWRQGQEFDHMRKCRAQNCHQSWIPDQSNMITRRVPHPLLAHLRDPEPHVRGCWVVDLILGKI